MKSSNRFIVKGYLNRNIFLVFIIKSVRIMKYI